MKWLGDSVERSRFDWQPRRRLDVVPMVQGIAGAHAMNKLRREDVATYLELIGRTAITEAAADVIDEARMVGVVEDVLRAVVGLGWKTIVVDYLDADATAPRAFSLVLRIRVLEDEARRGLLHLQRRVQGTPVPIRFDLRGTGDLDVVPVEVGIDDYVQAMLLDEPTIRVAVRHGITSMRRRFPGAAIRVEHQTEGDPDEFGCSRRMRLVAYGDALRLLTKDKTAFRKRFPGFVHRIDLAARIEGP